jgi:hypothetical protein
MLGALLPIKLDRPPAPRIWSAAACRRCWPSRLTGTCCNPDPIANPDACLRAIGARLYSSDRARQASPEDSGSKLPHSK